MANEMIRLPNGSLIMRQVPKANVDYSTMARFADLDPRTGQLMASAPAMERKPTFGQFLREKLAGVLPNRFESKPAPWWIPQGGAARPEMPPLPQNVQQGRIDPFKEIEAEVNREENIARELGEFSRKVMASPELIEGKWFSSPVRK